MHFAMVSGPDAQVVKLVDTHGSGPCAATHGGSSPFLGTISFLCTSVFAGVFWFLGPSFLLSPWKMPKKPCETSQA